jgi:hypothetical protein
MSDFVMEPHPGLTIEETVIERLLNEGHESVRYRDAKRQEVTVARADLQTILETKPGERFMARIKTSWPDRAEKRWIGLPHGLDVPPSIMVTLANRLAKELGDTVYVPLDGYGFPIEPGDSSIDSIQAYYAAAYDVGHG